jgi:hypothetical protein
MNRPSKLLFECWLAVLFSLLSAQVYSAQDNRSAPWNILVVPEYDQDSLAPSHRAYRTVGAKIQDQLAHEFRFAVYDGAARNINLQCKQQCDGLARAELIKTLREANSTLVSLETTQPAIDVLVFYHIMAKDVFADIGVKRLIRVSSLAIDLSTGNTIAYDDGGQQQARFINPAEDLTNWTLSIANRHARDSAAFIGERLAAYSHRMQGPLSDEQTPAGIAHQYVYLLAGMVVLLVLSLMRVSSKAGQYKRALAEYVERQN